MGKAIGEHDITLEIFNFILNPSEKAKPTFLVL